MYTWFNTLVYESTTANIVLTKHLVISGHCFPKCQTVRTVIRLLPKVMFKIEEKKIIMKGPSTDVLATLLVPSLKEIYGHPTLLDL